MPKNRQETIGNPVELQIQEQKLQDLHNNIQVAEDKLKIITKQIRDHKDLTTSITELEKEKSQLQSQIESAKGEIVQLGQEQERVVATYGEICKAHKAETVKLRTETELAKVELEQLKKECQDAIVDKKNGVKLVEESALGLQKQVDTLTVAVNTAKDQLENLQKATVVAQEDQKRAGDDLGTLRDEKCTLEKVKEELKISIEVDIDKRDDLIRQVEAYEKKLQKLKDEIEAKQDAFSEREGTLSLRESLLKDKTEQLRMAKAQLEEFFNKPLNTLII